MVNGDVAKAENKILKQMDSVSKTRIKSLKESIKYLNLAYDEKEAEAKALKSAIDLNQKIINRERNKKQFWKITGIVGIGTTSLLLLLR